MGLVLIFLFFVGVSSAEEGYGNIIINFASLEKDGTEIPINLKNYNLDVKTLEGSLRVSPGDYIFH